jgi:biofilm protein TabA
MIMDQLNNAGLYQFSNPRIVRGLEFLQSESVASLTPGRIDLDGNLLFALVQEYSTRPEFECAWEAHRKYIDIQYLVAGQERIDYAPVASLQISNPYDSSKDRANYTGTGSLLHLQAGMFAIFFPHDAHRPCMAYRDPTSVRKIVLKVEASDYDL